MLRAIPIRPRPAVAGTCAPGKPQALKGKGRGDEGSGPSPCPHSPECVEGEFSELRPYGVLRSSALRSTYGAKGLLRNGWCVRPDVHRVDRRAAFGQRVTREQLPHIPIVDPPLRERRAETTLAPPVHGGEAEVGRRREQAGGQDRVGPLEEGVGAAPHALVVEVSAKGSQILRGLGTRPSCFPQSSKALHVSNL